MRVKKFKSDICKVVGHIWNDDYICSRCKHECTYEEFPLDAPFIPHRIVMERLRHKYPELLPPIQKLVKLLKDTADSHYAQRKKKKK